MTNPVAPEAPSAISLETYAGQLVQESRLYTNVQSPLLFTTEDKVRLCLIDHLSRMEKRRGWIAPLGVLLAILVIFPTTTFKTWLLSASTWQAIFILTALATGAWLLWALREARDSSSIDAVVEKLKADTIAQEAGSNT